MKKGSSNRSANLVHQNSSSLTSSLANGKLKQLQGQQDEANLKFLRELSHIPANRFCFDCGQRGPNYVNVTIGSFVCMTCSGLLRGLTPPHRVKSISMASFTADELELLKTHGNEYCRKVWLATCSSQESKLGPENDPERLNNIKSFMSAKYEQKRYYIDPSRFPKGELEQIHQETTRTLQQQQQSNHIQKSPSLSSSTLSSNPSPTLNNSRHNNHGTSSNNRMINSITLPDIKPLSSLLGSSPSINSDLASLNGLTSTSSTTKSNNSTPSNFINNLTNGNAPWEGPSSTGTSTNGEFANFADFDDAFNNLPANSSSNTDFSFMNGDKNAFSTQSVPIPNHKNHLLNGTGMPMPFQGINTTPLVPSGHSSNVSSLSSNQDAFNVMKATNATDDKYAALKDLDSLFKQGSDGDNEHAGMNNGPPLPSLPNSTSLPANLASSGNANETGWFSSSANPPNPFSQASPSSKMNGWPGTGTPSGINSNPHNPFYNPTGNTGGWPSSMSSSNTFCNGMNTSAFASVTPSQTNFNGGMNGAGSKVANPFFIPTKPNPNNPFL